LIGHTSHGISLATASSGCAHVTTKFLASVRGNKKDFEMHADRFASLLDQVIRLGAAKPSVLNL
jgi:hypothetical protein